MLISLSLFSTDMTDDYLNVYVLTTGTCTAAPGEFLITPHVVFPQLGQQNMKEF